jgi:hypothetical protein
MPVVLDERTHEYAVDGRPVLGVTKALGLGGCISRHWSDVWYADRGTAIHKATELDDLGELDESSVDPVIGGFLNGWRKFRREASPVLQFIERKFYEACYGYCGTIDRVMYLNGAPGVLDIKSGAPMDWHGVQLAAYALGCESNDLLATLRDDRPALRRWAVYLLEDGSYSLKEYSDPGDLPVFLGALAVAKWKRNHGMEE